MMKLKLTGKNQKTGSVLVFTLILCCIVFLLASAILNILLVQKKADYNQGWGNRAINLAECGIVRLRQLMMRSGMTFPPVKTGETYPYTFYVENGRCDLVITCLGSDYYKVVSTGYITDESKILAKKTITGVINRNTAEIMALDEGQ